MSCLQMDPAFQMRHCLQSRHEVCLWLQMSLKTLRRFSMSEVLLAVRPQHPQSAEGHPNCAKAAGSGSQIAATAAAVAAVCQLLPAASLSAAVANVEQATVQQSNVSTTQP